MKVLSISNRNERGDRQKKKYYKGFPVMSDLLSRRSRKDSRECMYCNIKTKTRFYYRAS